MKKENGALVEHITWGTGRLVKKTADVITIHFASVGTKEFLYPSAFEKHLVMQDEAEQSAAMADLEAMASAAATERAAIKNQLEKAAQRKVYESRLLAEEKKKSRSRSKKKPSVSADTEDIV